MGSNGSNPKVTIQGANIDASVEQMVGVLFSGVKNQTRDNLISKLFTMKIIVGCCGKEYIYNFTTFPREDLKCACGKKGRWVVKYE